jgi:hypothetical protein
VKNAISFSLFGQKRRYTDGAVENVNLAPLIYPGWSVVVHAEKGHRLVPFLRDSGVEVVEHLPEAGRAGAFWRFQTLCWRNRFERVVCRDIDSRLNPRERAAVDDWIARGTDLHTMGEHPSREWRKISAGMFGVRTAAIPHFARALRSWSNRARYRSDENFLDAKLWPALKHSHTGHRRFPPDDSFLPFPPHPAYPGLVVSRVIPGRRDDRVGLFPPEPDGVAG